MSMDCDVWLGLASGDTEPNAVIRELEEALSVFFDPTKTDNVYHGYDDLRDIGYSLSFNLPVETAFEQACPHQLSVSTGSPDKVASLGVAFAKVAISGKFRAAMMVEGRDPIATTPGVPPE